jgi:hypothetical protein
MNGVRDMDAGVRCRCPDDVIFCSEIRQDRPGRWGIISVYLDVR